MSIPQGVKSSLRTKLQSALGKLNTALNDTVNGDEKHANNMLNAARNEITAFIEEVNAQKGKKISDYDAKALTSMARTIITYIDSTIATPL